MQSLPEVPAAVVNRSTFCKGNMRSTWLHASGCLQGGAHLVVLGRLSTGIGSHDAVAADAVWHDAPNAQDPGQIEMHGCILLPILPCTPTITSYNY